MRRFKLFTPFKIFIGVIMVIFSLVDMHCGGSQAHAIEKPTQMLSGGGAGKEKLQQTGKKAMDFGLYVGMIGGILGAVAGLIAMSPVIGHPELGKKWIKISIWVFLGCLLFEVIASVIAGWV